MKKNEEKNRNVNRDEVQKKKQEKAFDEKPLPQPKEYDEIEY